VRVFQSGRWLERDRSKDLRTGFDFRTRKSHMMSVRLDYMKTYTGEHFKLMW